VLNSEYRDVGEFDGRVLIIVEGIVSGEVVPVGLWDVESVISFWFISLVQLGLRSMFLPFQFSCRIGGRGSGEL
jgi:hypothetical protein